MGGQPFLPTSTATMAMATARTIRISESLDFFLSLSDTGGRYPRRGNNEERVLHAPVVEAVADEEKPRRKKRRSSGAGHVVLLALDRYLVQVSAGLVVGVWLISDWVGLPLSEGSKAAMASFVGYSILKVKSDERWRKLELERDELAGLAERLERYDPRSPEAIALRRELVALARRGQASGDDEEDPT